MPVKLNRARAVCAAMLVVALAALGLAGTASAKLTGEFTRFQQCPWTDPTAFRCLHSVTEKGEVIMGSKTVPIVNAQTLQGGVTEQGEDEFGKMIAAKNGITLSKTAQPLPGGLAGLVNCPSITIGFIREACKAVFENGVTGVNSTLELAKSASDVRVSESHLGEEIGVALEMPVKIHLENPFLGSNCYVGSSSNPIVWKLTAGFTNPPPPNKPIRGSSGEIELLEEGSVLRLTNAKLVDNAWAAPAASGCGGIFSFVINPLVNSMAGLPAAAGTNTAILINKVHQAPALAVKLNDEENP
jgi:hypothetical protein